MKPYGNKIIVYGGHNNDLLSDFHVFNVSTSRWESEATLHYCINGKYVPHERQSCVLYDDLMVFFGGVHLNEKEQLCSKLKVLNIERMQWVDSIKLEGGKPPARYGHTASRIETDMYVFGGVYDLQTRYVPAHSERTLMTCGNSTWGTCNS